MLRHFLRVDAGVAVGPSLGAVVFVEHGATLHLNDDFEDEAKVMGLVERASSGWMEVNEDGAAVPRRTATAGPVIIQADPIEPVDEPDNACNEHPDGCPESSHASDEATV